MLRRQRQVRTLVQEVADAFLLALSYWLAHLLRSQFPNAWFPDFPPIQPFEYYWSVWLVILPFGPILLGSQGFYKRSPGTALREAAWQAGKACALAVLGVIVLLFLLKMQLARSVIILFGPIAWLLLLAKEEAIRRWSETALGSEQFKRRFLVVGTDEDTARVKSELKERVGRQVEIVAELNLNDTPIERLTDLLHEHSPNGVILSAKHTYFGQIEKAIEVCELEGVEVWLLADFFKTQVSQTSLDDFFGRPTLVFRSTPEASWQSVGKLLLDVLGAVALLVLCSPLILVAALAVRFSSPGPVLFRQQRSGLNGRPFTMYKFRTMVTDAEQRQHELAAFNEMSGPVFKVSNDPRITPVGRWLRKYSIDELPQLLNVLRGEMSLVGPRPLPVDETKRFHDLAHRRRLSVKPGLTCLWQISGRNEVKDFSDWVRLDLEYIDNWSIWLDVKILFRTIPVVLLGTGAK
jgi:exopolysaccharide biosynthesis polyprenyl glycosylphosphotransferase